MSYQLLISSYSGLVGCRRSPKQQQKNIVVYIVVLRWLSVNIGSENSPSQMLLQLFWERYCHHPKMSKMQEKSNNRRWLPAIQDQHIMLNRILVVNSRVVT